MLNWTYVPIHTGRYNEPQLKRAPDTQVQFWRQVGSLKRAGYTVYTEELSELCRCWSEQAFRTASAAFDHTAWHGITLPTLRADLPLTSTSYRILLLLLLLWWYIYIFANDPLKPPSICFSLFWKTSQTNPHLSVHFSFLFFFSFFFFLEGIASDVNLVTIITFLVLN